MSSENIRWAGIHFSDDETDIQYAKLGLKLFECITEDGPMIDGLIIKTTQKKSLMWILRYKSYNQVPDVDWAALSNARSAIFLPEFLISRNKSICDSNLVARR